MSELKSHQTETMGSARGFGIVFAIVFGIIGLWPLLSDANVRIWSLGIAALLILIAWLKPDVLQPLNTLWFRFGLLLGMVITPVIMGILFFAVFTPMALCIRLLGKDLLSLKLSPSSDSYWVSRDREERRMHSMKNQF